MHRWINLHPDSDIDAAFEQQPWLEEYTDEIENYKKIDEDDIHLNIQFSEISHTVDVQVTMAEHVVPRAQRILTLLDLEFYSLIGMSADRGWGHTSISRHYGPDIKLL